MAGPWEKYQLGDTTAQPTAKGPWEKYGAGGSALSEGTDVENVMHPDITFKDRAVYKNFAVDPEAGFNYLQKQYPQLNFKKDNKGEILAKRPEELTWKKLDPEGFDFQDITDVAWDIPAGFVESAATALGGLAGGAAGLPLGGIGAVPGALAGGATAGAATGAGLETARQGIGKMLGVAEEFDPTQIGTSAAFGAVSPLLFGTGGVAKAGLKTAGKELTEEMAKQVQKSQRGIIGAGFDFAKQKVAPFLGETLSGVDRDVLRWASEPQNLAKIKEAEQGLESVTIFDDLAEQFIDAAETNRKTVGEKLGQELSKAKDVKVNTSKALDEMQGLVKKYEERAANLGTPAAQADFEFVKQTLDEYISPNVLKGELDAGTAFNLVDSLNDITNIRKSSGAGVDLRATKLSTVEKDLERTARKAANDLNNRVVKAAEGAGGKIGQYKQEYARTIDDAKLVNKMFKDPEAAERSLKGLVTSGGVSKRKSVAALSKRLGIPIDDAAKEAVAISTLAKGSPLAISSKGAVSTAKSLTAAGLGSTAGYLLGNEYGGGYGGGLAGGFIGGGLGAIMGGPTAMKQYMRMNAAANRAGRAIQQATPAITRVPVGTGQAGLNLWQQMMENER